MSPESNNFFRFIQIIFAHHLYSLNDSWQISQIENVMTFCRGWLQIVLNFFKDFNWPLNNCKHYFWNLRTKVKLLKMPIHQLFINSHHCRLLEIVHWDKHCILQKSFWNWISTATWISHWWYHDHILDFFKYFVFFMVIIPTSIVKILSNELKWWLSTVFLNLRHV